MTNIAIASKTTVPTIDLQPRSSQSTSENWLKAAIEHARRLTQMYGFQNADVAIAWETVEELRTSQSRKSVYSCQSAFDRYCADAPYALECRIYDC